MWPGATPDAPGPPAPPPGPRASAADEIVASSPAAAINAKVFLIGPPPWFSPLHAGLRENFLRPRLFEASRGRIVHSRVRSFTDVVSVLLTGRIPETFPFFRI